jgi:hypothetical protein
MHGACTTHEELHGSKVKLLMHAPVCSYFLRSWPNHRYAQHAADVQRKFSSRNVALHSFIRNLDDIFMCLYFVYNRSDVRDDRFLCHACVRKDVPFVLAAC